MHTQCLLNPERDEIFYVDEELGNIILNMYYWKFHTDNSCIDNIGKTWIQFRDIKDVKLMMQLSLKHQLQNINNDSLYFFLKEESEFRVDFTNDIINDPNNKDHVISTGVVNTQISLRFDKNLFKKFEKLFFEVFPMKSKEKF